MEIAGKIAQANGRLKSNRVGIRIQQLGEKLYLQGTFPPKPDSDRTKPFQQRIALGVGAHPRGVQLAEQEARKVGALLDCREFSWEPYLVTRGRSPQTVGDWIAKFEAEVKPTVSPITWKTEYYNVFKTLDPDSPLTVELLKSVIEKKERNSRTIKRFSVSLGKLAKFAGLEADFSGLKGSYSYNEVDPRTLPTDAQIVEWFYKIPNLQWRYIYGLIATFGLRNHEAFYLDTAALQAGKHWVEILEGKTGKHTVWGFYPEWVDQFGLRAGTAPPGDSGTHDAYGHRVTTQFSRYGIPFTPYDLRHRWAVRTLEFGLGYEVAAKQMGHSVKVHETTYHRWITADTHQRAFDVVVMRGDRPLPPTITL